MNIGAGRVVYQDLTRIDAALADGSFARNPALIEACTAARAHDATLHVMGLVSPGGVHSSEKQILAMLDLAAVQGVSSVSIHAFLDGRDTPPQSAGASIAALQARCTALGNARIATLSGRYYAMDRDNRWDRVELAYNAIVRGESPLHADTAMAALEASYARGETDEFAKPTIIGAAQPMRDDDAVICMNFRADRVRQIVGTLVDPEFDSFDRGTWPKLSAIVTLTRYSDDLPVTAVAWPPQSMKNTLGEYLAGLGLTQLRIAETEKYAHVTYFLSGGREQPFAGEERILVPSPKVATYDLQPEMSCPEVTDRLVEAIRAHRFDFIACNLANPDMVGHTGIMSAAIAAAEAVDVALGRIVAAITESGTELLITADHGNLEIMRHADGVPHTQHTVGPVPLVYVGRRASLRDGGALRDLAPTVLALMGLAQPDEMTGHNLVEFKP